MLCVCFAVCLSGFSDCTGLAVVFSAFLRDWLNDWTFNQKAFAGQDGQGDGYYIILLTKSNKFLYKWKSRRNAIYCMAECLLIWRELQPYNCTLQAANHKKHCINIQGFACTSSGENVQHHHNLNHPISSCSVQKMGKNSVQKAETAQKKHLSSPPAAQGCDSWNNSLTETSSASCKHTRFEECGVWSLAWKVEPCKSRLSAVQKYTVSSALLNVLKMSRVEIHFVVEIIMKQPAACTQLEKQRLRKDLRVFRVGGVDAKTNTWVRFRTFDFLFTR